MKYDPIQIDRKTLAERVTDHTDSEPLDIITCIVGAAIVAMMFFAWIS